jgi:arylsulfatase
MLVIVLFFGSAVCAADKKPNILVIVVDDMGFSDLGSYGGEIETPNIDSLATGGLRFTQFYNTARCWPTRSALMTGYYPQQIRSDPPQGKLPQGTLLIPHYLKPLGYRTYHSGKWHVPGAPFPVKDGGFDRSYELLDHNHNFYPQKHRLNDEPIAAIDPENNGGYYTTNFIAEQTIHQLREHAEEHAEKPFFAYTAFTSPHFPLQAPQNVIDKYRDRYVEGWDAVREKRFRRQTASGIVRTTLSPREENVGPPYPQNNLEILGDGEVLRPVAWETLTDTQKRFQAEKMAIHAAMVDCIDQQVGRIIETLKSIGQWENTVIFLLSDNGCSAEIMVRGDGHDPAAPLGSGKTYLCLGPGWSTASNTPFRRHKIWTLEGGISTPLIVHWPEGIPKNRQNTLRHETGHVIDLLPTILDLTGLDLTGASKENDSGVPLPGESLLSAVQGKSLNENRKDLFFLHEGNRGLRSGNYKAVSTADKRQGDGEWKLYDLSTDRSEQHDLAAEKPEKLKELVTKWELWNQTCSKESERP